MAEQLVNAIAAQTAAFKGMKEQWGLLAGNLGCRVDSFNGERREAKGWIEQLEKCFKIDNIPEERKCYLAYRAAKDTVSTFIGRSLEENAELEWRNLKEQIVRRFGEGVDKQAALTRLQQVRQRKDETALHYAERFFTLSSEAFSAGDGGDTPAVQRQLVNLFTAGLISEAVKVKIIRANPQTLDAAIAKAQEEQETRERIAFQLGKNRVEEEDRWERTPRERGPLFKRQEEPMEIDHTRGRRCYLCNRPGHKSRDCEKGQARKGVNEVSRDVVCWGCGDRGHMRFQCRSKDKNKPWQRQGNEDAQFR